MQTKIKLAGAKKGHDLLKQKADALKKKFREVMLKILEVSSMTPDQEEDGSLLLRGDDLSRSG
jgi:vacuolar-type H+-ATPase subunit D/Vma8